MPENLESPSEPANRTWRRGRRQSEVSRETVMGIDALESKIGYVGAVLAVILAGIFIPHLLHNTTVIDTAKAGAAKLCPKEYHYNIAKAICQRSRITHPSDWVLQFAVILLFGFAMAFFSWRSKRAGVAVSALFLGLALGTVGFPFLLLGGWLIVRALRLQKYGDASFAGSNRRAREKAQERRASRSSAPRTSSRGATRGAKQAPKGPSTPAPSKRYTPKQPPRKR